MKFTLLAAVLSVCMLMSSAYPWQAEQRQRQDASKKFAMMSSLLDVLLQSFDEVQAEGKKKNGYQIGEAVVGSGASGRKSKCSVVNIGKSAEGQAKGCEHADCTAAKNAARAALRNLVPQECYPYIESNGRCKRVNC